MDSKKPIPIIPSRTKEVYFSASYVKNIQRKVFDSTGKTQSTNKNNPSTALPTKQSQLLITSQTTKLKTEGYKRNKLDILVSPTSTSQSKIKIFRSTQELLSARSVTTKQHWHSQLSQHLSCPNEDWEELIQETEQYKIEELMTLRPQTCRSEKIKFKLISEETSVPRVKKGGGGALENYDPMKQSKSSNKAKQFILRQKIIQAEKIITSPLHRMDEAKETNDQSVQVDPLELRQSCRPTIPSLLFKLKQSGEISIRSKSSSPANIDTTPLLSQTRSYLQINEPLIINGVIQKLIEVEQARQLKAVKLLQSFFRSKLRQLRQDNISKYQDSIPSLNIIGKSEKLIVRQQSRNMFASLMENLGLKKDKIQDTEEDIVDKVSAIISLLENVRQITNSFNEITQYDSFDRVYYPRWKIGKILSGVFSPIKSNGKTRKTSTIDALSDLQDEYPQYHDIIEIWQNNFESHNALFVVQFDVELNNQAYQLRLNLRNIELFALINKDQILNCPLELMIKLLVNYYDQNNLIFQKDQKDHFVSIKQKNICCQDIEYESSITRKLIKMIHDLLLSHFTKIRTLNGSKLKKINESFNHSIINRYPNIQNLERFHHQIRRQLGHLPNIYIQFFENISHSLVKRQLQRNILNITIPLVAGSRTKQINDNSPSPVKARRQTLFVRVKNEGMSQPLKSHTNINKLKFFQTRSFRYTPGQINQLMEQLEARQTSKLLDQIKEINIKSENDDNNEELIQDLPNTFFKLPTKIHEIKLKYDHFKQNQYFREIDTNQQVFLQQFNPIQELQNILSLSNKIREPIHIQIISCEGQQIYVSLNCQFNKENLNKDFTAKQVNNMLKNNYDIGILTLELRDIRNNIQQQLQVTNQYSFQQFGTNFFIDSFLILRDLFQRCSLTTKLHLALSQCISKKLHQKILKTQTQSLPDNNIQVVLNNQVYKLNKFRKTKQFEEIKYISFKTRDGQTNVVFQKFKFLIYRIQVGFRLLIYTLRGLNYIIVSDKKQISKLIHFAKQQLNTVGILKQSNNFLNFIKTRQTTIGKKSQVLLNSIFLTKFNYQLNQHSIPSIYLFALKCILQSNLGSFNTIFNCYFNQFNFRTTKRINNLNGLIKVDSTFYQLKNSDYLIIVIKLVPLDTRTIRYTLIINHNDLKTLNLQSFPFSVQVIKILDMIYIFQSDSYKSINIIERGQEQSNYTLKNRINIIHLKNPVESIIQMYFLIKELKNTIVVFKKTKCINLVYVIITVELDRIRKLVLNKIYIPHLCKFFKCQFKIEEIEALQNLDKIFPLFILENQHLLSHQKSYRKFLSDLYEIYGNLNSHISQINSNTALIEDIDNEDSQIHFQQKKLNIPIQRSQTDFYKTSQILASQTDIKWRDRKTSKTIFKSTSPQKFSQMVSLPQIIISNNDLITEQPSIFRASRLLNQNKKIDLNKILENKQKMLGFYFWDRLLTKIDIEMNEFNKYIYVIDSFRGIMRQYLINSNCKINETPYTLEVFFDQQQLEWGSMFEKYAYVSLSESQNIQIYYKFQDIFSLQSFNYKVPLRQIVYNYADSRMKKNDIQISEVIQLLLQSTQHFIKQIERILLNKRLESHNYQLSLNSLEEKSLKTYRTNQFGSATYPHLKLFSCYKFIYQCVLLPDPQVVVTVFFRPNREIFHFYVEDCSNSLNFTKRLPIEIVCMSIPYISHLLRLQNDIDLGRRLIKTYKNALIIEMYTKFYSI